MVIQYMDLFGLFGLDDLDKSLKMSKHIVFIDEAGNTGSRLIDEQPFLSMIGIGLPVDHIQNVLDYLDKLKSREKITRLHAKNLRDWRRHRLARELLEILMEEEMSLFVGICEKKYVISTFIEDDFFDPVFNDKCDNSWTHPNGKRERANIIFQCLSDEASNICAHLFHKGENGEEAYKLVLKCLKDTYLYDYLDGLRIAELEELIRELNCNLTEHSRKKGVLKSPNFFTMLGLLSKIEYHYRESINEEVGIVFDSSPQYDSSFITFFSLLKNAKSTLIYNSNLTIPNVYGYTHLKEFRCVSSESEPMLQIADVVITSINDLMRKLVDVNKPPLLEDSERFILWLIYQHWQEFNNRFCDYVMSNAQMKKIFDSLIKNAPD